MIPQNNGLPHTLNTHTYEKVKNNPDEFEINYRCDNSTMKTFWNFMYLLNFKNVKKRKNEEIMKILQKLQKNKIIGLVHEFLKNNNKLNFEILYSK